jgi:hypothetical protein
MPLKKSTGNSKKEPLFMKFLLRQPSEYILVSDQKGNLFRLSPGICVPAGYKEVTCDKHGESVYGADGQLLPRYWALQRIMH